MKKTDNVRGGNATQTPLRRRPRGEMNNGQNTKYLGANDSMVLRFWGSAPLGKRCAGVPQQNKGKKSDPKQIGKELPHLMTKKKHGWGRKV